MSTIEKTPHTASGVDQHNPGHMISRCRPQHDPFSIDPVVWVKAYLASMDWLRPIHTVIWFSNAMSAAAGARVEAEFDEARPDD